MKILYTSDLHGEIPFYQELLKTAGSSAAEMIILGGDLLPTLRAPGRYEEMLLHQGEFIIHFLFPFFEKCLITPPVRRIFLLAGNWDLGYCRIFEQPRAGVIDLNQKSFLLEDGYELIGYPFVPPTPFRPKEFEKMDDREAPWPTQKNPSYRLSGGSSYQLVPVDPEAYLKSRGTIQEDLQHLPRPGDFKRASYVMHSPPFGTSLDLIQGGMHVGSRSIRSFIEKRQPLLTLHGHVHESPKLSGAYWDRLGETLSINPGQCLEECGRSGLQAVTLELMDPGNTLQHTKFP